MGFILSIIHAAQAADPAVLALFLALGVMIREVTARCLSLLTTSMWNNVKDLCHDLTEWFIYLYFSEGGLPCCAVNLLYHFMFALTITWHPFKQRLMVMSQTKMWPWLQIVYLQEITALKVLTTLTISTQQVVWGPKLLKLIIIILDIVNDSVSCFRHNQIGPSKEEEEADLISLDFVRYPKNEMVQR